MTEAKINPDKVTPVYSPINTDPKEILIIRDKMRAIKENKNAPTLSLHEMIVWNAARLNSWAFCTKHKIKYKFHEGCKSCNQMCKFCGDVVDLKKSNVHHQTCKDMPKGIKKRLAVKFRLMKHLGEKLDEVKKMPGTKQNMDIANNLRQQISRL